MAILNNQPKYWFRTKWFRITLIVVGAVVVLALVVFSEQIGQLLDLFGSRAGINQETLQLNDTTGFLQGAQLEPTDDSFQVVNGRLMLNDPSGFIGD